MFGKPVFDRCRECNCGEERLIVNKTRYLCEQKNRERLDRNKQPKKKESLRQVKQSLRQISSKRTKEQLEYKKITEEIIQERGSVCESCGNPSNLSFSHLVPRSRRKDLICIKDNIKIQCMERSDGSQGCHSRYESGKIDDFIDKVHILQLVKSLDKQYYLLKFGEYDK